MTNIDRGELWKNFCKWADAGYPDIQFEHNGEITTVDFSAWRKPAVEKPLDHDDIVSAGWKLPSYHLKSDISPDIYYHPSCGTTTLIVSKQDGGISLSIEGVVSFIGSIRNKSELLVLMRQLGITE